MPTKQINEMGSLQWATEGRKTIQQLHDWRQGWGLRATFHSVVDWALIEAVGDELRPNGWEGVCHSEIWRGSFQTEELRCKTIGGSRFFIQEEFVAKLIGRRVSGLIWKLRLQSKHILFAYVVCCVLLLWVAWGRVVRDFYGGGRAPLSMAYVTPAHKGYDLDITPARIRAILSVLAVSPLFSVLLQKNQNAHVA